MAAREIKPLALLYVYLSDRCRRDDLDKLKTFVDDDIPPRQLEGMNNATDIFKSLEDKGIISSDDVNYLKTLFTQMEKKNLVTKIEEYEANHIRSPKARVPATSEKGSGSQVSQVSRPSAGSNIDSRPQRPNRQKQYPAPGEHSSKRAKNSTKSELQLRSVLILNDEWGTSKGGISTLTDKSPNSKEGRFRRPRNNIARTVKRRSFGCREQGIEIIPAVKKGRHPL
ncbi:uncharacterized protein [Ptychodera flava]|uniref:uncharacterized protein n=1 Tax=Ptychodera flava TaxID=63121 RepID=UPI00396A268F